MSSDFKVLTPTALRIATLEDEREAHAFEYFHLFTLPTIRIWHNSPLWTSAIAFFGQRHSTFRAIAIALGLQQRLQQTGPYKENFDSLSRDANLLYSKAVKSLRESISTRFADDQVSLAFACLLFCALESLRDSPAAMLPHLKCGAYLLSTMKASVYRTGEVQALSASIKNICMTSLIFCRSRGYSGDFAAVDVQCRVKRPTPVLEDTIESYSLELSSIVQDTMRFKKRFWSGSHYRRPSGPNESLDEVHELMKRRERLRIRMHRHQGRADAASQRHLACLLAGSHLSHLVLDETLDEHFIGTAEHTRRCENVLNLLTDALTKPEDDSLSHIAANPFSFALGLDTIQQLEIVINHCADVEVRRRAYRLLDSCPEREGMWRAAVTKEYLQHRVEEEEDQSFSNAASGQTPRPMPQESTQLMGKRLGVCTLCDVDH